MLTLETLRRLKWRLFRRRDGEAILRAHFRNLHGRELDTAAPQTFCERLCTRMVEVNRHGDANFTRLADKLRVRDHVRERLGEHHLVKLLWSGRRPEEVPFDALPGRCVIKTNHGSGGNIVFDGRQDRREVVAQLNRWLKESYYWTSREYHYHAIPPRLLVEEFLDDGQVDGPLDYRFWCFHGRPELIQVDNHRHDIHPFHDTRWRRLDLGYREDCRPVNIPEPPQLQEMLRVAAVLAADFDFVRVDLYNVRGRVLFGELTFTPVAGRFVFQPAAWDVYLGRKWAGDTQAVMPGTDDLRQAA